MKRIIAAFAALVASLFVFSSCEDVELQVRASLDCRYPSKWISYNTDRDGNEYVYEGFDSRILMDDDIVFIFNDITHEWDIYGMFDYAVLTTRNYNKLDGKYRYSNRYLFVWDEYANTYVFKDVDDLTPQERIDYGL